METKKSRGVGVGLKPSTILLSIKQKKDDAVKSKSTVQLIKYDHSPSATEASSDVSAESGPNISGAYPLSPERASDSSNFSEGANSDISPERDLSPVARRHVRVNRAHRAWQARSEYFTPTMVDGLSMQGRSRSLDTREFIRELVQVQDAKPEWKPSVLESGSSVIVIRDDGTPLSADDSRQFTRTQSFNLGGSGNESGASVHARKKSVESNPRVTRPPIQNTPELAVTRDKTSYTPKSGRRLTNTPVRNVSDTSRKSSDVSSSHSRSSSLCSADASSDTSKTTVRHVGSTPSNSISSRASTTSNESKMEKKRGKNSGKISDDKDGRVIDELVSHTLHHIFKQYYKTLPNLKRKFS